jgi:protein-disulfide isomerase
MKRELLIPAAIIFGGVVIAVTIYITHPHLISGNASNPEAALPITSNDHLLGNPEAPVVLVEYADVDSEYSKDFQAVMEEVIQNYGTQGNVAWIYRDFPLVNQDPTSEKDDEAAECAAGLGSQSTFFAFIDAMQAAAPGDTQFDPSGYDSIASSLGISTGSFDDCLTAHTYQKKIEADYASGKSVGVSGTPYSVLFVKGQKPITISGSVPYATMKQILDTDIQKALAQ